MVCFKEVSGVISQLSPPLTLTSKMSSLVSLRSTRQSRLSLGFPGAPAQVQPSEPSLSKASSIESALSANFPGSQVWDDQDPGSLAAPALHTETLEARVAKAKAWETQAYEAQNKASQPKQTSVLRMESAPPLKQKPSIKKTKVPEKKKSGVPYTRPLWSNKVQYILAQVGYSVRAINLWWFPYMWLHHGGCKSGDQELWVHKGLARQKPSQGSNAVVSGTCRGWRLSTRSRRGGGAWTPRILRGVEVQGIRSWG